MHVSGAPFAEGAEGLGEGFAEGGEGVGDAWGDFVEVFSGDDGVGLHLAEGLDEHFFADGGEESAEFSEAFWAGGEVPEDEGCPFAAGDFEGGFEAAGVGWSFHWWVLRVCHLPKGRYLSGGRQGARVVLFAPRHATASVVRGGDGISD